jgi:hypothetical protein
MVSAVCNPSIYCFCFQDQDDIIKKHDGLLVSFWTFFFDIWCSMSSMFVFAVVLEYKMLPLIHWYYIACGLFCHKIGEFWCAIIVELLPRIKVGWAEMIIGLKMAIGLKWLSAISAPHGYHICATWLPHQRWCCRHVAATSMPHGCHVICYVTAHHQLPSHQLPCPHPSQRPTHLYKWHGKLIHDDHFHHRFWASGWV